MRLFIKLQLALCLVFLTSCQSQPQQVGWGLGKLMIAGKMTVTAHSNIVVSSTSENQGLFGGAKRSRLVFTCENKGQLAVFLFPRSLVTVMKDGKRDVPVRMTIDDKVNQVNLVKHADYPILFFKNTPTVMNDIVSASSVKIELSLPNGEQLSFDYELKDVEKMIQKVRTENC